MDCEGLVASSHSGCAIVCHDQGIHPSAEVSDAATIARKGFLDGCQTPVVAGVAATLGFVVQRVDEWCVTVREGAPDCLFDMEAINVAVVVIVIERSVPLLQFSGGEPMAQELNEEAEVPGVVVLDLDADPHQRLGEFAERVPAGARAGDKPGVLEFADLFGRGLLRHQAGCRYVLHGDRSSLQAKELEDLALRRSQLAHSVLVVRCQIIDHVHERSDQVVERLLVEEVEQHDVRPVVAGREVMDGTYAGASHGRAQVLCQFRLAFVDRLLRQEFDARVQVHPVEHADGEEAEERIVLQRQGGGELRGCRNDGPVAVLLDGRAPALLALVAEPFEQVDEVLAEEQQRLVEGVCAKQPGGECLRGGWVLAEGGVDVADPVFKFGAGVGQCAQNPDDEVEVRGDAPLLLFEEGDGDAVGGSGGFDVIHETVVGESEKVRLARPSWPDQENVVFLRRFDRPGGAGQDVLHHVPPPHEEGLEGASVHVPGTVAGAAEEACSHVRVLFHHRLTSCQRKS